MLTLKDFMEVTNYRITEGSEYLWNCFGPNAYRLDSWNGDQDGHTISILFDNQTQTVYQVEALDYKRERAYRLTNPEFKTAFDNECKDRDVIDTAWERDDGTEVEYVDLDVDEDFLEKARAIVAGEDYDTRVQMQIEFTDEELLKYMKLAHERDMTFNDFVEEALRNLVEEVKMRDEYDFSNATQGAVVTKKKKKGKK